jgi:hypothetical protein
VPNKTFLVMLKPPSSALQHVVASTFEIRDEHLIFCDSEGKLAAMFLLEIVQSWNELSSS